MLTYKRFSEKPIVAFTNSTEFILDFYIYIMTKPVWPYTLALSAWTLKKPHYSQLPGAQITNICMQGKFLTN